MTFPVSAKYKCTENLKENDFNKEEKNGIYVCNICGRNFYRKAGFTIHVNSHNFDNNLEDGKGERQTQHTCNMCFKKFTAKKNLLKHLREVHKNFSEAERMLVKKIKCPKQNCDFLCRMMKELRVHIEKCHKIKILKDVLEFPNEAVFLKWKKEEETNTVSWFVTGRQKNTLTDGTKKQILYCHRTGHYNPKGFGKYRMRSVGSCKIGVTCPAAMEVVETPDGGLTVIYYKTHLGHMQDVVYLKLSNEERAHLAEKIKEGFSFDSILEDVKESKDVSSFKKKRIHLLSKKDLYSIMRKENCNNKKNVRKKNENQTCTESTETQNRTLESSTDKEVKNFEKDIHENISVLNTHGLIPTYQNDDFEGKEPNTTALQGHQEQNVPQTSKDGITSQIVILSPDMDCMSIAEILLLSQNETNPGEPTILPQTKIGENHINYQTKPSTTSEDVFLEEKNTLNKSKIHLRLKEKLQKISDLLPQSEYLSPRQFDLINTKLDSILDIFNVANSKARSRKKKLIKKQKFFNTNNKISNAIEYKVQETVQLHEQPFQLYAVIK